MRYTTWVLACWIGELVFAGNLAAQPVLDRVEQLLRDQVGAAQGPGANRVVAEPGYLGLIGDDQQDQGKGIRVMEIVADGPAAKAGLQVDDLITSAGGQPIRANDDMGRALQGKMAGARLPFVVIRGGKEHTLEVTLGRRPRQPPRGLAPGGSVGEIVPSPNASPAAPPGPRGAGEASPGPRLGVRTLSVSQEAQQQNNLPDRTGAMVIAVAIGSPAERVGIPVGAIIKAVNGQPIETPQELAAEIRQANADEVELTFWFRGEERAARVSLVQVAPAQGAPPLHLRSRPPQASREGQAGPLLGPAEDSRTAALEARIRLLEERVAKLEAALEQSGEKPDENSDQGPDENSDEP